MTRPGIRRIPFHASLTPLAFCAFAATPVHAQETAPDLPCDVIVSDVNADPAAALEVAAARAAWVEAFTAQDLDGMMSFYAEDIYSYDLMAAPTGDGPAMAVDGEASWRQNWISFFEMFDDDLVVTIDDLTVYQKGDLATVRDLTRLEGTLVGGPFVDMWVRETNVLRRVDDRWLVPHDHVSVPFDFATGQALTSLGPIGL